MLYGVDIHARYQGGIDLARLKAEGYTFMCTKASEGTSIPSSGGLGSAGFAVRFLGWVAQARKLGMVPGLYHWLKAGNAAAQAQFFHALVQRSGGPQGMLIQLDCEDNATYPDVLAWAKEWERLTDGHPFLLYTGKWWWGPRGWDGTRVTPYLWDSHYLTADADVTPDDPAAMAARVPAAWWRPGYGNWPAATILQFTSRGDAGSLGNNVDLNAFRGTRDELLTFTQTGDIDMDEKDKATATADTWRLLALLQNLPAAEYQIPGEPAPRVEVNLLRKRLDEIAAKVDQPISDEQLERVMRKVLGGVDGATPAAQG